MLEQRRSESEDSAGLRRVVLRRACAATTKRGPRRRRETCVLGRFSASALYLRGRAGCAQTVLRVLVLPPQAVRKVSTDARSSRCFVLASFGKLCLVVLYLLLFPPRVHSTVEREVEALREKKRTSKSCSSSVSIEGGWVGEHEPWTCELRRGRAS